MILAFAGLINFTNMTVTNIITRRHDFLAAMQSIGMTNRQLRRLIMDEGLYYAAGADVNRRSACSNFRNDGIKECT